MAIAPFVETLDGVEEAFKPLYVETEGGFLLDAEMDKHPSVVTLKTALDQEREKRKKANEAIGKFKDVDLTRWAALSAMSDEELSAFHTWQEKQTDGSDDGKGDDNFEERLDRVTRKMRADHKKELEARDGRIGELDTEKERLNSDLRNFKVNQRLLAVAQKQGAQDPQDFLLRANGVWKMDEDGEPAAYDDLGDLIRGPDGVKKISMEEWIDGIGAEAKYLFKSSAGGGAGGSGNGDSKGNRAHSKKELGTPERKAAFIGEYGQDAYLDLPSGE